MSRKILIVDDTKSVRMFHAMLLRPEGYELEEASNGEEALERIHACQPDLVLMDILMPQMDGVECCRKIKSNPNTKHIPVMMVTTKGHNDQLNRAYAAGCDEYITKPIQKDQLMSKIRMLLDGKRPAGKPGVVVRESWGGRR